MGKGEYVLCTVHRQENTDNQTRFLEIINGLKMVSRDKKVVFPVHPRTAKLMKGLRLPNVVLTKPLGYLDFLSLESHAALIVTNSGGLQEEGVYWVCLA